MYLKKISLLNFKNLEQEELSLVPGINCLVGDNGTCKTNIVDAIYYLSMCKSALAMSDRQCVRHGQNFFVLDGEYENDNNRREKIICSYSCGAPKVVKRNGKQYERLADHVGLVPVVIVSPSDSALISDSAEERRRYLNGFISQYDKEYLVAMMRYNAALAMRNSFLKSSSDEQMLAIYDMQLAATAEVVHRARRQVVEQLLPLVAEYYRELSGDREQVVMEYRSELNDKPLAELLLAARERDLINGFTTVGVHRDDLLFRIGDYPLRKYGSQGQQKSFLIALKLAQYHIMAQRSGEKPILLLDDVFDKLDESRVGQLISVVSGDDFGQIVITDCNGERMQRLLDRACCEHKLFNVTYGKVEQ